MKELLYDEFEIVLEHDGGGYCARVVDSPTGTVPAMPFLPPVETAALPALRMVMRGSADDALANEVTTAGAAHAHAVAEAEALGLGPKAFGKALFKALFNEKAIGILRTSQYVAAKNGHGLRLRIRFVDVAELANLPWELLYDPDKHKYLCQYRASPTIRLLDLPEPVPPIRVDGPLRMLVVISGPRDLPELHVEKEWMHLRTELAPLVDAGRIELVRLEPPTLEALRAKTLEEEFHVFHFVGHGGIDANGEGHLAFVRPNGLQHKVPGSHLGVMLSNSPIRLAVLNSCEGGTVSAQDPYGSSAIALVEQGIPAVIAMQFPISDLAALNFSRTLYDSVAAGRSVDLGVTLGRQALLATSESEWATPVLYLRGREGTLFELKEGPVDTILEDPVEATTNGVSTTGPIPVPNGATGGDSLPSDVTAAPDSSGEPVTVSGDGPAPGSAVPAPPAPSASAPSASAPPPSAAPAAPSDLVGAVQGGWVDLTWRQDAPADGALVDWEVSRDGKLVSRVILPRASDEPPGPGTYHYTVVAMQGTLQSPPSSVWTAVIPAPPLTPPTAARTSAPTAGPAPATASAPRDAVPPRPVDQQPAPLEVKVRRVWRVPVAFALILALVVAGWILGRPSADAVAAPTHVATSFDAGLVSMSWDPAPAPGPVIDHWEVYLQNELIVTVTGEPSVSFRPERSGQLEYRVVAVADDGRRSDGSPAPVSASATPTSVPSSSPSSQPSKTLTPPAPTTADVRTRIVGVRAAEGDAETVTFETDNWGAAKVIREQVHVSVIGGGEVYDASYRQNRNGDPQPCTVKGSEATCELGAHPSKGVVFLVTVTVGWGPDSTGLRATAEDVGGTRDPVRGNNEAVYPHRPTPTPTDTSTSAPPDSTPPTPTGTG